MPTKKTAVTPPAGTLSPRDQTWKHYADVLARFRKLCRGDSALFQQAEARIKAKRATEAWIAAERPAVDAGSLARAVSDLVLSVEDEQAVDALYRRKLAFRDQMAARLGKGPLEGWDPFFDRCSTVKATPGTVKVFEAIAGTEGQ